MTFLTTKLTKVLHEEHEKRFRALRVAS